MFDKIIDEIKEVLSSDSNLSDVIFVDAYRSEKVGNPLVNNIITLGVKGIQIKDKAFGKYLGIKNGNECFGKRGLLTIYFNIYVPKNSNGKTAAEIFSRICDTLLFYDIQEQILSIECGDISFKKDSGAFVLESFIKLDTVIGQQNDELDITSFIVRRDV